MNTKKNWTMDKLKQDIATEEKVEEVLSIRNEMFEIHKVLIQNGFCLLLLYSPFIHSIYISVLGFCPLRVSYNNFAIKIYT